MKITEKILLALALIGITFSFIPFPGGSVLTVLSLSVLSLLYFYFSFALLHNIKFRNIFKKSSYAGISTIRIVGSVASGMVISTLTIGLLFELMMWPGASAMMIIGVVPALIIIVISFIKYLSGKSDFYKSVLVRIVPLLILTAVCMSLPQHTILNVKYRCCPDYVKAVQAAEEDPFNEELQQKAEEEERKMNGE